MCEVHGKREGRVVASVTEVEEHKLGFFVLFFCSFCSFANEEEENRCHGDHCSLIKFCTTRNLKVVLAKKPKWL